MVIPRQPISLQRDSLVMHEPLHVHRKVVASQSNLVDLPGLQSRRINIAQPRGLLSEQLALTRKERDQDDDQNSIEMASTCDIHHSIIPFCVRCSVVTELNRTATGIYTR